MAQVLAEAIALRNSTPMGDYKTFLIRQDHVEFLMRLSIGKL